VSDKGKERNESPGGDPGASLTQERGSVYGPPDENHERTARLWRAYLDNLDKDLDGVDVCFLNILQKIARAQNGVYHSDHFDDIDGYARNARDVWRKVRR